MRNDRNALKDLQHSLESLKGNLHVLETNVPVDRQMEYFRFTEAIRSNLLNEGMVEEQMETLASDVSSPAEIRYALAFLAISGSVKAYRAIEAYNERHPGEWATLSLMQAKITLESEFSDEKQVFIYTGLGGKDDQLRFYAFFKSNMRKNFSEYQKQLIEKEITFSIQKHQGTLEEIYIGSNYFTVLFLVRIQLDIKMMLEEAIAECNQYGNFINKGFTITNTKVFSEEEIQYELMRRE